MLDKENTLMRLARCLWTGYNWAEMGRVPPRNLLISFTTGHRELSGPSGKERAAKAKSLERQQHESFKLTASALSNTDI